MKNYYLAIILLVNIVFLSGKTIAITEEPDLIPFTLQNSKRSGKLLFTSDDPTQIIIEINTTSLTTQLSLYYSEHISGTSYNSKYKELFENDYINISSKTNHVSIGLRNDSTIPANFTASGTFRIHKNGYNVSEDWKSFDLLLSTPRDLEIYQSEGNWVNNISIYLNIEVITNGTLELEYSSSDASTYFSINQIGEYEYLINTTYISLYLESEEYAKVMGLYALIDNGKLYTINMDGFTLGIVIVLMGLLVKKRIWKYSHVKKNKIKKS